MKIKSESLFCYFITVSQTHMESHEPYNDGFKTITDLSGEIVQRSPIFKSLKGDHGSNR